MKTLPLVFEAFEAFLHAQKPKINSFHPFYADALWEMVQNGGKRFRPQLLLLVVFASNKKRLESAFHSALALEILHTYSLIHDDLPCMDDASLRRGHQTLHLKYNQTLAILVGDALNTHSFYLIAQSNLKPKIKTKLIQTLSQNAGIKGMVLGQALDCHFEQHKLSQKKLQTIHHYKTAKLIAAALKMGAIIASLPKKQAKRLYGLGLDLGLLFQICDDLVDATQSEKEAGKNTQNDGYKNSYVNLLGIQGARHAALGIQKQIKTQIKQFHPALQKALQEVLSPYFLKEIYEKNSHHQ